MTGVRRSVLVFASIFAIHFFSEQQVLCSQRLARSAGLSFGNFVEHLFHHLNVTKVGSSLVNDMTDCAIACLRVVTCFSFNVEAQPDIENRILCELLASDKYNFSEKFQANPHFHHHAIHNKCSEGPCVNGGKCIALYSHGDFKCKCLPGFKGKKCETDVDECKESGSNCSSNATCQNTPGSFKCTCNSGYQGDGVKCDDIDECYENKDNCDVNATCKNTAGSFNCTCNNGYQGDGVKCDDIDECYEDNCDVNAVCKNTEGSFTCTCNNGYQGDGVQCSDIRLPDSKILRGHSDYEAKLSEYLAPVQVSGKQWMLCFRASEHQYRSAAFHTACDNKGPTMTLVRVGIYVFGGYTDKSWGGRPSYISSNAAFLFSLKNHVNQQYKMLVYNYPQYATYNQNNYGPAFGISHDLLIHDDCNANANCYTNLGHTYKAPNGYIKNTDEIQGLLAGSYYFKCDEYEVFYQV